MPPTAHFYIRASGDDTPFRREASAYLSRVLEPLGVKDNFLYQDESAERGRPLRSRPKGSRFNIQPDSGDHLVIVRLSHVTRRVREAVPLLLRWYERGLRVHVLDLGLDTGTADGRKTLALLIAVNKVEKEASSEFAVEKTAKRKVSGKMSNGSAPLGSRIVGHKGSRRTVPDPDELATMEAIYTMHEGGLTFEEIFWDFFRRGVTSKKLQREWSLSRIKRAYLAYVAATDHRPSEDETVEVYDRACNSEARE